MVLGKQKNVGGGTLVYCTISLIVMHGYRTNTIHGKLGLQLCLKKNQNAPKPSEFVTLHLGSDGCH